MSLVSLLAGSGAWLLGVIILKFGGGESNFALYSIGVQWFSLAMLLPILLARASLPRIVHYRAGRACGLELKSFVNRCAAHATLLALLASVFGVFLSPWLISAYGPSYEMERWLIAGFMAAAVIAAPANIFGSAILASDGQRVWLVFTMAWILALTIRNLFAS
jgi:O-antigen/teichoic acid export membrane protein